MFNMNKEMITRRRGRCPRSSRAEREAEVSVSILDSADLREELLSSSAKRVPEDEEDAINVRESG